MPQWLTVAIEPAHVQIAPGATGQITVRLINHTGVVNQFLVMLLGLDERMAPPVQRIGLFPEQEDSVTLAVNVPADRPPDAGRRVVAVRVVAENDPRLAHVEEFPLTIAALPKATVRIQPTRIRGGSKGSFGVVLTNEGNVPLALALRGEDDTGQVRFEFVPPQVNLPPRSAIQVDGRARAKRPWAGAEIHRQLTVHALGAPQPASAAASFAQKPLGLTAVLRAVAVTAIVAAIVAAIVISNRGKGSATTGQSGATSGASTTIAPASSASGPTKIPSVQGMSLEAAKAALAVFAVVPFPQADNSVEKNKAIGTDPAADMTVQAGSQVKLLVSTGPTATFDLAENAAKGQWENNDGSIAFAAGDATSGFVKLSNLSLSDGTTSRVLATRPKAGADGKITGTIDLPGPIIAGDMFVCDEIALAPEDSAATVDVGVYAIDAKQQSHLVLDSTVQLNATTNRTQLGPVDLSVFAGMKTVALRVTVPQGATAGTVYWTKPRVTGVPGDSAVKPPSGTPTASASATPTVPIRTFVLLPPRQIFFPTS